jgi:hypothetical protein
VETLREQIDVGDYGHPKTTDGWLWLYLLCHLDLTEHGCGIAGSWTTGFGDKVLAALEQYGCDPDGWGAEGEA